MFNVAQINILLLDFETGLQCGQNLIKKKRTFFSMKPMNQKNCFIKTNILKNAFFFFI
jgi:hypothetical protein